MPRPFSQEKRQEWKDKIQDQQASGLSISKWCSDQQVNVNAFYYWKDRLCPKGHLSRASFTELTDLTKNGIRIEYRGFRIYLDKNFEASLLKQCIETLKDIRC